VASLTTQQMAVLSTRQIASLTTHQIQALSVAQWRSVSTNGIRALIPTTNALEQEDLAGLKTNQFAALSTVQIQALTPDQMSQLTTGEIAAMTVGQIKVLSTDQPGRPELAQSADRDPVQFADQRPAAIAGRRPHRHPENGASGLADQGPAVHPGTDQIIALTTAQTRAGAGLADRPDLGPADGDGSGRRAGAEQRSAGTLTSPSSALSRWTSGRPEDLADGRHHRQRPQGHQHRPARTR
jgi:hypothetical protein